MFMSGFANALVVLILSIFFNIMLRVLSIYYSIEPIVFSCMTIIGASLSLLIYAGPGRLVKKSFNNKATWIYGVCSIISFIVDIILCKYMTATEMSLIARITIPFSILAAYLFLNRKPTKIDLIGLIFLSIGLFGLVFIQKPEYIMFLIVLLLLMGFVQTTEFIMTETHNQSVNAQKNGTIRDKARVVGFVSFITSIMFLSVAFIISLLKVYMIKYTSIEFINFIPNPNMFVQKESVIFGLIYGVTFSAILRYCLWSATYKFKTENLLSFLVFVPLFTMIFEYFISFLPGMSNNMALFTGERGTNLLLITILITLGSGIPIFYKVKKELVKSSDKNLWKIFKQSLKPEKEEITIVSSAEGDYEIVKQTLGYTNGSYEKAAELLNLTSDIVKVLELGKGAYALKDEVSVMIQKNYRENVLKFHLFKK